MLLGWSMRLMTAAFNLHGNLWLKMEYKFTINGFQVSRV